MKCEECDRLKCCIYAIVSELVNNRPESALKLGKVGMYGGSVTNPLDCHNPERNRNKTNTPQLIKPIYHNYPPQTNKYKRIKRKKISPMPERVKWE